MTNNELKLLFVLSTLLLADVKSSSEPLDRGECLYRFDYDYKVLQKLASLETKIQTLENEQQSIQKSFSDERRKIEELKDKVAKLNETGILHGDNTAKRCTSCRDGWLAYNGSCYYFGHETINVENAKTLCAKFNAYLVHVETMAEDEFLKNVMYSFLSRDAGNYFWLGMTDSETEGVWKWFHDGSNATYLGWVGSEPQNYGGPESCAIYTNTFGLGWADVPCEHKYRPVCEMRL